MNKTYTYKKKSRFYMYNTNTYTNSKQCSVENGRYVCTLKIPLAYIIFCIYKVVHRIVKMRYVHIIAFNSYQRISHGDGYMAKKEQE